jgi:nucleotide-binding universal stress UspA family protein
MHILVATDGILDPELAADAVERWHEEGDAVTVLTAVNVPTDFLRGLGEGGVAEAALIAREAGQTLSAGDRAAERLIAAMPVQATSTEGSPVLQALERTARSRTRPLVKALAARGIEAKATWRTSENRTAQTIVAAIKEIDARLVIIGSHGYGRFEGLLGSTGAKLVRHAPSAVLVLRNRDVS